MAKVELKFIDSRCGEDYILTNIATEDVMISGREDGKSFEVYLDIPTAIKFSKTLQSKIRELKSADFETLSNTF